MLRLGIILAQSVSAADFMSPTEETPTVTVDVPPAQVNTNANIVEVTQTSPEAAGSDDVSESNEDEEYEADPDADVPLATTKTWHAATGQRELSGSAGNDIASDDVNLVNTFS